MSSSLIIRRALKTIDAGHRVKGHESKCSHVHGHTYAVEVEVSAPRLDHLGRVVDFSIISQVCDTWCQNNWDHNFIHAYDESEALLCEILMVRYRDVFAQGYKVYTREHFKADEAALIFEAVEEFEAWYQKLRAAHSAKLVYDTLRFELCVYGPPGCPSADFRLPWSMPKELPNPTAENLGFFLLGHFQRLLNDYVEEHQLGYDLKVNEVQIWETPKSSAICRAD